MPILFITGPSAAPVRLTTDWQSLALPAGAAARVRQLGDDQAAVLENVGTRALHVEVEQHSGSSWELTQFIAQGEYGVIGSNTRLFVDGLQASTTHHVTDLAEHASDTGTEGAEPGSSKRPLPSSEAGEGGSSGEDAGKRQRRASREQAAPTGSRGLPAAAAIGAAASAAATASAAVGTDPYRRVPDTPMHLMRVRGIPSWANEGFLGLRLADLVRSGYKVQGDMQWALVSNYMMDLGWLLSACPDLKRAQRLVLVHGERSGGFPARKLAQDMAAAGLGPDRCTLFAPPLPIQWGTHHSKAFILQYQQGLRVIIFTANAIYPDCNNKSQGLFWQDFPPKDEQSPQTSPFEQDLAAYLAELRLPPGAGAKARELLAQHDFSSARGHLIASVPGYHAGGSLHKWGHMKLRAVLNREAPWPASFRGTPLAAQFSSLGSIDDKWLDGEFRASLAAGRCGASGGDRLGMPPAGPTGLQLVWTTVGEIQNSLEGWAAGQSIPGPAKNVCKPFLQPYYRRWDGEVCGRQRAMPHIKTYLRYRPMGAASGTSGGGTTAASTSGEHGTDDVEVAWMLVTSHNLSKAAWGALQKQGSQLMIRSYEVGVLLTPTLEAAYRASRWRGFSCTSAQPPPAATCTAPEAAAAAAGAAEAAAGPSAGDAAGAGMKAPAVTFLQWRRGMPQEPSAAPSAVQIAAAATQLRVPLPIPFQLPPQRYQAGEQAWTVDGEWQGVDSLGRTKDNPYGAFYGLLEQMDWADLGC